jgi:hypothetical protein
MSDAPGSIEDVTETRKDERRVLVEKLVDKENPEMITFVLASEVDDIATLQTVGKDLDEHRSKLNLGQSFLTKFISSDLVIRTSIKGKRSVQIVDTVHGVMREEVLSGNPLSEISRKILGR